MSEHKKCPVCRGEPFIKSSHDEDMCYWERVECRKCGLSTRGKWASDRSNACAIFREEVWAEWDDRAEPEREVEPVAWIPVSERLPEKGMFVLVYTPPCYGQEEGSTGLDLIDPSSDGDVWLIHSESYEHYCAVSDGINCTGPDETALYTHWMPLPAAPKEQSEW